MVVPHETALAQADVRLKSLWRVASTPEDAALHKMKMGYCSSLPYLDSVLKRIDDDGENPLM